MNVAAVPLTAAGPAVALGLALIGIPLCSAKPPVPPAGLPSAVTTPVPGTVNPMALKEPPGPLDVIAEPAPMATDDGVMAPRVSVIAGVVVGLATVPEMPFAVTTETDVTVPEPPLLEVAGVTVICSANAGRSHSDRHRSHIARRFITLPRQRTYNSQSR